MLLEFEKKFPQSTVLPNICLMLIDVYRQKNNRPKIIEYGEKALKLDDENVTAMIILSRNYAIERKNLNRALELAQKAVDLVERMKSEPMPQQYSGTQWKTYLQDTEAAARNMLQYVLSVKGSKD
ncbi:MAG: hypothetical protein HY646_19550 [Acidobacteria bacterium]|nr:hypothetical protein [Acidobacteriota bacterium]